MRSDIAGSTISATVAIVARTAGHVPPLPVIGAGFCIDKRGVIVTAAHVLEMFRPPGELPQLPLLEKEITRRGGPAPAAVFSVIRNGQLSRYTASINATYYIDSETRDLAVCCIDPNDGFPLGFPELPTIDTNGVYAGMEVGICGYPHAPLPEEMLGTVTPMLAQGIVAAISPYPTIHFEGIKHFVLDINAGRGSSGGPAFCANTGRVFGVVQGGITRSENEPLRQGVVRVDPLWPVYAGGAVERLLLANHSDRANETDEWKRRRADEIVASAKSKLALREDALALRAQASSQSQT